MAKVKFDRNAGHKNIGEIKVTIREDAEELCNSIFEQARHQHPDRPVSTNWSEYQKIDAMPEKK